MQLILVLLYSCLLLLVTRRVSFFAPPGISRNAVSVIFLLKISAGCLLGYIYTYYYTDRTTADTFKFFDDGKVLFSALRENPMHFFQMLTGINADDPALKKYYEPMNTWFNVDVLFNDNRTLVRLNAIFCMLSFGYYYVHVVFINFFSLAGLIALYRVFYDALKSKPKILFAGVLLLPSMIFWGSGLLKDGFLLFALGMLLYSLHNIINEKNKRRNSITFFISLMLLMITKLYVLVTIFPGLAAWYWSKRDTAKIVLVKFLSCYTLYLAVILNSGLISEKYDVVDIIYYKQKNFYTLAEFTNANSVINIEPIAPTAWSIMSHSPEAVLRVLLRPWLSDISSALIALAAFENMLILVVIMISLLSFRKGSWMHQPLFYFSVLFVVFMFSLIGMITPILGAIVRYKVPALPFLMFIFIAMADEEKFFRRLPFLQKLVKPGRQDS